VQSAQSSARSRLWSAAMSRATRRFLTWPAGMRTASGPTGPGGAGELDDHRGSPFRAARTALRKAVRAAPAFRSSWEARSALIPATRCSGIEARDPCRSVTRSRNRAVLVAFLGCGAGAGRSCRARRPGATGHSWSTQARNPARVEAGARARRRNQRTGPPRMASGVAVSSARWWRRARAWARTTPMRVSLARA
jgi:hypothetical protein